MPRYLFKTHSGADVMQAVMGHVGTCRFICLSAHLSNEEIVNVWNTRPEMAHSFKRTKRRTLFLMWDSLEDMLAFDIERAEFKSNQNLPRTPWWRRAIWGPNQ